MFVGAEDTRTGPRGARFGEPSGVAAMRAATQRCARWARRPELLDLAAVAGAVGAADLAGGVVAAVDLVPAAVAGRSALDALARAGLRDAVGRGAALARS